MLGYNIEEFTILELDRHRLICTFHQKPTQQHKSQSTGFKESLLEEGGAWGEAQEAQLMPALDERPVGERAVAYLTSFIVPTRARLRAPGLTLRGVRGVWGSGRERDRSSDTK